MGLARIALALLVVALAGCKGQSAKSQADESGKEEEPAGVSVRTEPAQRRTIAATVYGMGRCEPLPRKVATLTPAVEGRVLQILANQGDWVKPGQAIVELDPTIAQSAVAEKSAARDGSQASLRLLESLPRPKSSKTPDWPSSRPKWRSRRPRRRWTGCGRCGSRTRSPRGR